MAIFPEINVPDTPLELAIDAVLDRPIALTGAEVVGMMDPHTLQSFIEDVAQGTIPYEKLSVDYGFSSNDEMIAAITGNEEMRRRMKARRAIWKSEASVEVRARQYACQTVIEAIPHTSLMMVDDRAPPSTRLDALKAHARIAGVDGLPPGQARDVINPAGGGGRFSINIIFSGGKTETITTIDANPEPENTS